MGHRSMGLSRREWLIVLVWLATLSCSVGAENSSTLEIPFTNDDEPCVSVSYMKVNTSHVGPENPKLLTEVINFTIIASWTRTGIFGMKIFADNKTLETRQIEMDASKTKKCGDELQHVFHVVNYGPSDPEIQGHPQLDVLLYVLPSVESDSSLSCQNSSFCVRTEIIYHFAPAPKNVKFISYPTLPTVGKYLNLSCNTKDGSPPVVSYSMHMYDYYIGSELFGALLKTVLFTSAKAGKYRCAAINYPFGHREEVYSRIITVKPEIKTSPPTTATTERPVKAKAKANKKAPPRPDMKIGRLVEGASNMTVQPEPENGSALAEKTTHAAKAESEAHKNTTQTIAKTSTTASISASSLATRDHPWNQMIVLMLSVPCMIFTNLLTKL